MGNAIAHQGSNFQITAGFGSGKAQVISARIYRHLKHKVLKDIRRFLLIGRHSKSSGLLEADAVFASARPRWDLPLAGGIWLTNLPYILTMK